MNQVKHPEKIAVGIENTEKSMTLQAVIFDLDGVIVDTAKYHFKAWARLADSLSIPFTEEQLNENWYSVHTFSGGGILCCESRLEILN